MFWESLSCLFEWNCSSSSTSWRVSDIFIGPLLVPSVMVTAITLHRFEKSIMIVMFLLHSTIGV